MEIITDVYGTGQNVSAEYTDGYGKIFREKYQGKIKITETIGIPASSGRVIQICHVDVVPVIEESRVEQNSLIVEGVAYVSVFCMMDKEDKPYEILKKEIPFSYTSDHMGITSENKWKINSMVEQCNGIILDEDKLEVKMILAL